MQGFNEPRDLDNRPIDSPVASLATIRTLLFMAVAVNDVVSSIDVSTAFLQADEYDADSAPRFVHYQPTAKSKRVYWRLRGVLYGQRSASMAWHSSVGCSRRIR